MRTCRHPLDSLYVHHFASDELRLYCTGCNTRFDVTVAAYWSVSARSLRSLRLTLPAQPIDSEYRVVQVSAA